MGGPSRDRAAGALLRGRARHFNERQRINKRSDNRVTAALAAPGIEPCNRNDFTRLKRLVIEEAWAHGAMTVDAGEIGGGQHQLLPCAGFQVAAGLINGEIDIIEGGDHTVCELEVEAWTSA